MSKPNPNPAVGISPEVAYLRTLPSVRSRCTTIFDHVATTGEGEYFTYNPNAEDAVADYCIKIIQRDFGTNYAAIPPHGRWRHFDVGGIPRITTLLSEWAGVKPSSHSNSAASAGAVTSAPVVDRIEAARRLVDLFMVSVLLDAGAGTAWKYEEKKTGLTYSRSEGLAVASLDMFLSGRFSSNPDAEGSDRHVVTAGGLKNLSPDMLAIDLQVHPHSNPMTGLEGRTNLLIRLGEALESDTNGFFVGPDPDAPPGERRPGFLVDYLARHPGVEKMIPIVEVPIPALWEVLMYGLAPIWPASRTKLDGVAMGDVWPNSILAKLNKVELGNEKSLAPFHKLTQWLNYSLLEAMEKTLGWRFVRGEDATGLPEYRNGGLFVDLGVLTPKASLLEASQTKEAGAVPSLPAEHAAIVEWRALTVILLDRQAQKIRQKLGLREEQLDLKQLLEAATWKAGREIASEKRGETGGGPPINILSDGTVF
ncbi:related to protein urg3 [Ustilago sp. UG-2017a]|nr:related to protein urg3 [Ustilago sp. UG-2017a]